MSGLKCASWSCWPHSESSQSECFFLIMDQTAPSTVLVMPPSVALPCSARKNTLGTLVFLLPPTYGLIRTLALDESSRAETRWRVCAHACACWGSGGVGSSCTVPASPRFPGDGTNGTGSCLTKVGHSPPRLMLPHQLAGCFSQEQPVCRCVPQWPGSSPPRLCSSLTAGPGSCRVVMAL